MLMFVVQDQPHSARTDLRRKLVACLLAHGSTFSRVGASDQPGAVHCDVSTTERTKPNWAGALLRCGILMPPMSALGHFRQIGTVATLRGCLLRPESGHWELSTRLRGTKVGSKVAAEFFWRGGCVASSHLLSSGPEPSGGDA